MKSLSSVFLLVSALPGFAASVLWNDGFSLDRRSQTPLLTWRLYWNYPDAAGGLAECLYPTIDMTTASVSGRTRVSAVEEVTVGYGYQWVSLEEGQVVSSDTTRNLDSYFQKGWIDWIPGTSTSDIGKSDYSLLVSNDGRSPFYLGFAAELAANGEISIVYGWVQIYADGTDLRLGNSAIDLSGRPLVVGQTPEPSSSALAIAGLGLLICRRKRGLFP